MLPRLALAAAIGLGVSTIAGASRADEAAALRDAGHAWFDGERSSGWLWGGAGVVSIGGATFAYGRSEVGRGVSYPLAGFGVLQLAIGAGSLLRPRGRDDAFDASIARSPDETRRREMERMRTTRAAFFAIEVVEVGVVIGASAWAATRTRPGQERSRGVGIGLAMEGGAMLFLDAVAAARAGRYAGRLEGISVSVAPGPSARGLSLVGRF